MFHLESEGSVGVCEREGKCGILPIAPYHQFHSARKEAVEFARSRMADAADSMAHRVVPLVDDFEITDQEVGPVLTDHARLVHGAEMVRPYGTVRQMWLHAASGHVIAFIQFSVDMVAHELQLYDIEVRPEFRGRGLGRRTIAAVEKLTGMKMTHDGGYTVAGLRAIAPMFHDSEWIAREEKECFSPVEFVEDWDHMIPTNRP